MGQAILPQHGFQGVDLGGDIQAHVLQQRFIQFGVGNVQGMQNPRDLAADLVGGFHIGTAQPQSRIQQLAGSGQVIIPETAQAGQLVREMEG